MNLPTENMLVAYWFPQVGIGPPDHMQYVRVPLTDVLTIRSQSGKPQIDVVHLCGATFHMDKKEFTQGQYLDFKPDLLKVLTDGSVRSLQSSGVKVVLNIMGNYGDVGWSSIPDDQIQKFVNYLNTNILDGENGYGLDGIDIDDEYAPPGDNLVATIQAMHATFPSTKIISKALAWESSDQISQIKDFLTYGCTMDYGDSATGLEGSFEYYVDNGFPSNQLLIGVNAGPTEQRQGNFTSLKTAQSVAGWQSTKGKKLGMMLWSFSQDIQQFTAFPQNQQDKMFPNSDDHLWQRTIFQAMNSSDQG